VRCFAQIAGRARLGQRLLPQRGCESQFSHAMRHAAAGIERSHGTNHVARQMMELDALLQSQHCL
jgi:hypothetical protein